MNRYRAKDIRVDLQIIADMIEPGTRVLDVGCGDGQLLDLLVHEKRVDGRGIELSTDGVHNCVSNGLSVIQGDAEKDLPHYPDDAFDYVILSQTLQAMHAPREILDQMLRIGKRAVVSFPNFGYWRVRWRLLLEGRMPKTRNLPWQWYDTPNIHLCTIKDFLDLCAELGITVEQAIAVQRDGRKNLTGARFRYANLLGEQAVFLLSRDAFKR